MTITITTVDPHDFIALQQRLGGVERKNARTEQLVRSLQNEVQRIRDRIVPATTEAPFDKTVREAHERLGQRMYTAPTLKITAETRRQMFGLMKVCFGTCEREARMTFTRTVLDWRTTADPSWSSLYEVNAIKVLRALEAICAVEELIGRRVAV